MKRWGIIGASVVLLAAIFVMCLLWLLPPNPVYNGKRLSVWLESYNPGKPPGVTEWNEADDALRHIGTNAIPLLLHSLRAKDSKLKLKIVELAQKQELFKIHFIPAADRRLAACGAFIALGNLGKDAVPGLIEIYNEDNSIQLRGDIENVFAWVGPGARPAIPLLLRAATNSNLQIRANALWALGDIHAEPQSCVPVLIEALHKTNYYAAMSAAHALGMFGTNALEAIPPLTVLAGPSRGWDGIQCQVEARRALEKIKPQTSPTNNEPLSGLNFSDAELLNLPK